MDVLEEVGSTLEDEYESIEMEFEESVKEERNNGNNKSDKERKTRVVKSNVDVTIVKDAKSFIDKVIEVRGLNKDTVKCRVVPDKSH